MCKYKPVYAYMDICILVFKCIDEDDAAVLLLYETYAAVCMRIHSHSCVVIWKLEH
jgi:hypothetical protein